MKGLSCVRYTNSCFFMAMLQCVLHIPQLTMYFLHEAPDSSHRLVRAYRDLVHAYFGPDQAIIDVSDIKTEFNTTFPSFDNPLQHDAHEAMTLFLDALDVGMRRETRFELSPMVFSDDKDKSAWESYSKSNYSILSEIVTGQYKAQVKHEGTVLSSVYAYCNIISVPLTSDVRESIGSFFQEEDIEGYKRGDVFVTVVKQNAPVYMPLVLTIHLKRFLNDGVKLDSRVAFQKILFVQGVRYHLFALYIHTGSAGSGHYYSVVESNNQWCFVNDAYAKHIEEEGLESHNPYMLMYKKL